MRKERIVVAMSGGVDSSVAAALLKKREYEVIGVTMKFWGKDNRCCSDDDLKDARSVASRLGIPHYTVSFHESFEKNVVDYFVSEYTKGRTPNPCAVCNPSIKFGDLLKKADDLRARFLATGHYAVIGHDAERSRFLLKRGKERSKDQSYFLARLSQEALSRTLFPIGNFSKKKIRMLAKEYSLSIANKTESQEVCFVPDGDVAGFIRRRKGTLSPKGPIISREGKTLGFHEGIIGYTIGQRKGLGIAVGRPVYVTKIDAETHAIFVGDKSDLYHRRFSASDPHWISMTGILKPIRVKVRIRYKHRPAWASVKPIGNKKMEIEFDRPQRAITPGQLAVFYDGDIVVGSAWIDEVVDD
jgi:tRNA-specific 2-thiouridylase